MVNPVSTGRMAAGPVDTVQPAVLYKLIIFALAMAIAPIGTYFLVLNYFSKGNTIASAISAIIAANIVLVGYIVVAWLEGPLPPPPSGKGIAEVKKDK
ncbi:uncharacterized protein L201_000706 [Kwoniella dendrophila CBS 6074]|uniref:Vacuolar ATPase assembly integral membrane protein VMA21 n=1 Tax=Kwoniella dendrophila CBS 6074 TaxID=1295534 RepID=A0AAX4JM42_9TREE